MAMTKKERAEVDTLVGKLELLAALRWTVPAPAKDLIPTYGMQGRIEGWAPVVYHDGDRVEQYWSSSVTHGRLPYAPYSGSQRGKALYSSKMDALMALRAEAEVQCAERLRKIDQLIAAEKAP